MLQEETVVTSREQRVGIALFVVALLLGAWLRFHHIGVKPFHHDEGVNAYFLLDLVHHSRYAYNPENYHGPTLYYFAASSVALLGETDLALRFWPALFGVLAIGILWWMRKELSSIGLAAAGLLIAVSPGLVYFSRDFIHEMSFGFFTLGIVVFAWRYLETRSFPYLAGFALSLGLLFATKETAFITVIVLALAAVLTSVWQSVERQLRQGTVNAAGVLADLKRELRSIALSRDHVIAGTVIFLAVNVIFYSSLFSNLKGVSDAVLSVILWSKRSGSEHVHAFGYYFGILLKLELPLLIGGLVAGVVVVWRGARFGLFLGAWTLGIFLVYSIIPYKTPWLMVNILLPLTLLAGYGAAEIYRILQPISPRLLWSVACLVGLILAWQMTLRVNFERYDDNENQAAYLSRFGKQLQLKAYTDTQYGYVYAQTERDIFGLVAAIEAAADKLPSKTKTGIYLSSPAYWPLPWYLRKFDSVAYTGSLPDLNAPGITLEQPLLIGNVTQQQKIESTGIWKAVTEPIALRPGERLMLFDRTHP